jgi:ElaB/YqjD/DUF883 family membrane-anchored ribosome-binding protein
MADKADDVRREIKKGEQDIKDTRSAITEKLALLKEHAQETVDSVKQTFDLRYQVNQRPWLMFGGSLLVGYLLGRRCGVTSKVDNTASNSFKGVFTSIRAAAFGAITSSLGAMAKRALLPSAPRNRNPTRESRPNSHFNNEGGRSG